MPISLPPISRRRFLTGTLATGTVLLTGNRLGAADIKTDPNRFILLADTHISGNRDQVAHGTNMFANMQQVGRELIGLKERPAGVLIAGDCAYLTGKTEDYAALIEVLRPIREAGIQVHFALGNHDHRERFWRAFPATKILDQPVAQKHVRILETPHADIVLLDSLDRTNKASGVLGKRQLDWLAKILELRQTKPVLLIFHHNPDTSPNTGGLTDTQELLELITSLRQLKSVFFGHTHVWRPREQDGIHWVNLPPTAYVFKQGLPNGWVDLRLEHSGATLQLHCLDSGHPAHQQKLDLQWRT